jgi:hypothetical protein
MTPCSSPLFFLGYFFLNSVVPMLKNCASFGVGGRASSRPWAWPRRRWFGGEVLLTVFWGLTPWTHAVKPVAKRKQSHALARPRRTTRPPCSRIAFTVAGASRPRASTPGSRSALRLVSGNPDFANAPAHGHADARFYDRQQDYGHARGR